MSQVIVGPQIRNSRVDRSVQWECRPCFVRDYVWPINECKLTTTALTSLKAPPLPRPPPNELMDVKKCDFIRDNPHLFRITTPVKINRFSNLLSTHPNRLLVESACEGLKATFWPWAVTIDPNTPPIIDNAMLQRINNPNHLQFMMEQRDEEIRVGYFSEAFTELSPVMTTIPLWVVPKPHSDKSHLVVDHSAGDFSSNSYISSDDAGVHLDTLHILGKALIRVKERHGSVPLVLFKTDVSQAYCCLPMHPLWQLRQIVMICDSHHIDNNNNFGN